MLSALDMVCCRGLQTEAVPESLLLARHEKDVLPVILSHSGQDGVYNKETGAITWSPPDLLNKAKTTFRLSRLEKYRRGYKKVVGQKLRNIGFVDDEENQRIIDRLFNYVQVAVPGVPLVVLIVDVNVEFLGGLDDDDDDSKDRVTNQTKESIGTQILHSFADHEIYFMGKLKPATRSSSPLEGLEQLRLEDLGEAIIRQTPSCAICLEDFAQGAVDELITRLPCAHYYHSDCLLECLKTRQTCPSCRYPMPQQTVVYRYI